MDSTQPNDTTGATAPSENIKCTSDNSGAFYPSTTTPSFFSYPQVGEYAPRLGAYTAQWGSTDGTSSKSPSKEYISQFNMSGGPPQHPHGRQAPPNSAWNHLQVPNFYPARQPQHAHMSSDLSMLASHQPTWHTPTTTEPSKGMSHNHLFNLQQMLGSERPFPRHSPGVDLSLTRNGSQNGDLPQTPISLSVRDTKQINSLPMGAALDGDRAVELTKGPSPGLAQDCQPNLKGMRRPTKRMDSIIDRLNTNTSEKLPQSVIVTATSSSHDENSNSSQGTAIASVPTPTPIRDDEVASPVSNEDSLDSNKSRRKRKPSKTIKVSKEDEVMESEKLTPLTTETPEPQQVFPPEQVEFPPERQIESLPSPASVPAPVPVSLVPERKQESVEDISKKEETKCLPVRRRSSSEPPTSPTPSNKSRRKTVSESETIDNIAAMVAATSKEPLNIPVVVASSVAAIPIQDIAPLLEEPVVRAPEVEPVSAQPLSAEHIPQEAAKTVSVIRDSSNCSTDSLLQPMLLDEEAPLPFKSNIDEQEGSIESRTSTPQVMTVAQKKGGDMQCFVAVEDELEKMFAGIEETESDHQPETDPLAIASTSNQILNDSVSSTSNEVAGCSNSKAMKRGRPPKATKNSSRRPSESNSTESTPRKKHKGNKKRDDFCEDSPAKPIPGGSKTGTPQISSKSKKKKKANLNKSQLNIKLEAVKDIYSYDSGSNASSSRSKGPFIQIKGPRDSPISVSIVNTPCNEDDPDKPSKQIKNKKFHDDSEYRHKVRSKGLHCSTLSNKYDAQTRDATWICVFCKRGPHATDPLLPGPSPFTLDLPHYSPGDLFGPYIISTDCAEYQRRLEDPFDIQFKSKKSALTAAAITGLTPHGKKSKKRLNSESSARESIDGADLGRDAMFGIAEVTQNSFEVWVHEDCVTWGPGVYLVGPKIVGLEGAVWGACSVACKRCGLKGAAVCCLKRGCGNVMHIGCAKFSNWKLDEDNYRAFCTEHSVLP